jgi:hypothetical protein
MTKNINQFVRSGGWPVCIRTRVYRKNVKVIVDVWKKPSKTFDSPQRLDVITQLAKEVVDLAMAPHFEERGFSQLNPAQRDALLTPIAEKGYELFSALVPSSRHDEFKKLLNLPENGAPDGAVSIRNSPLRLPWEFVYLDPVGQPVNPIGFLGQKHLLARISPGAKPSFGAGDFAPKATATLPIWKMELGAIYDDQKYTPARPLARTWFMSRSNPNPDVLDPLSLPSGPLDLSAFLFRIKDAFLFCCGWFRAPSIPHEIDMRIRSAYDQTFQNSVALRLRGQDHVLVMFDVDNSAYCEAVSPASLAERMHHNGATAVVASMGKVDPIVSEQISEQLFLRLTQGASVAAALLFARRRILQLQQNPTALFWTAFGDVWDHLDPDVELEVSHG